MSKNRCIVEISPENGQVLRIFKHPLDALKLDPSIVRELPRSEAVESVRRQVFQKFGYECRDCGRPLVWESGRYDSGEMHEVIPRGKGGEISVFNSVLLCRGCHTGDEDSAHGDRRLRFGETHD